ncbi:GAF domain-containing protein [Desulfonatronospira sp.]|uniref:GAF domain-containing protein n=1 Tax=Desulfonatronospira sp. TaxID=1962951 RepID=UPI0025C6BC63|nr:GAF domain-containing protein [Desulfonatronospira sp.]
MNNHRWLDRILGLVCSVFDGYSAVLFLRDPDRNTCRLAASFSLGDSIPKGFEITAGTGLVGWIAKNSKPLLINNFERDEGCLGYYTRESESKIKAFMGCPLPGGAGVLCVDSKKTYSFSDKDQKILYQFAQLTEDVRLGLVQADENIALQDYYRYLTLIQKLRQRVPRWRSFLNQLLELLSQSTGFKHCFMAARDERGEGYYLQGLRQEILPRVNLEQKKFNIDSGLLGWVFKHGSPIFSGLEEGPAGLPLFGKETPSQQFTSVICMPLQVHKKTRGILVLADTEALSIDEDLRGFVHMVGDYLALFLENLYLKSRIS